MSKKTETVADDIDTDSPFVIVNGRIVENPYYKFKKGAKKEASEGTAQIDSGVYVVRSRNPSLGGKPNFVPPNKRITETKTPGSTAGIKRKQKKNKLRLTAVMKK